MTSSTLLTIVLSIAIMAAASAQTDCVDRTGKWQIAKKTNDWCKWARKYGPSEVDYRCTEKQIVDDCPVTCGAPCAVTPAPSEATDMPTASTPAPTVSAPPAGGRDDPHLWTWAGEMYDYHGQCDLIYTTCPKFDHNKGLHVHLRTEFVEPMKWSTIASIAVQIGEDVLEVQNNGAYYLNGAAFADLTDSNLAGHELTQAIDKSSTRDYYSIDLTDNMSIDIKVRTSEKRDSLSFAINGIHEHRAAGGTALSDCVGLTSTWEHPAGSRFLVGRSGNTYAPHEAADFGPEWQVDFSKNDPDLFKQKMGRQLPKKQCDESPLQSKDRRHLKKLTEADGGANARQAEEACAHLRGNELFDSCYFDVLVTGDVTFAEEPWYTGEEF